MYMTWICSIYYEWKVLVKKCRNGWDFMMIIHSMLWNRNASKISFWRVQCRSVVLFFRIAVQGARRTAIDVQNARSTTQALHSGVMNGEFDEQNWDWNARKPWGTPKFWFNFLREETPVFCSWLEAGLGCRHQIHWVKSAWEDYLKRWINSFGAGEPKGAEKGIWHPKSCRTLLMEGPGLNWFVVQLSCCELCDFSLWRTWTHWHNAFDHDIFLIFRYLWCNFRYFWYFFDINLP